MNLLFAYFMVNGFKLDTDVLMFTFAHVVRRAPGSRYVIFFSFALVGKGNSGCVIDTVVIIAAFIHKVVVFYWWVVGSGTQIEIFWRYLRLGCNLIIFLAVNVDISCCSMGVNEWWTSAFIEVFCVCGLTRLFLFAIIVTECARLFFIRFFCCCGDSCEWSYTD